MNIFNLIEGMIYYKTRQSADTETSKIGLCIANDIDNKYIEKLGAKCVRVSDVVVYSWIKKNEATPFWVTVGTREDSNFIIANKIVILNDSLKRKPLFYAVINEDNDTDFERINDIRKIVNSTNTNTPIIVVKGSHTACTESAARKIYEDYFKNKKKFVSEAVHILHFYLKPHGENYLENTKRKYYLSYIVKNLRKLGVKKIILGECHDGDKTKPGFPDENDFVYASKEGLWEIQDIASVLSISTIHYYQSSFLGKEGNTVL